MSHRDNVAPQPQAPRRSSKPEWLFPKESLTRILVVDDRPDVRLSFLYMLQSSGYEVAEAASGAAALEYLSKKRADVVLTDLYMPDMDGLALMRVLNSRPQPRARIIAMSGTTHLGNEASMEAARVLGADAVLRKPFTREQLIGAIRFVLGHDPAPQPRR